MVNEIFSYNHAFPRGPPLFETSEYGMNKWKGNGMMYLIRFINLLDCHDV